MNTTDTPKLIAVDCDGTLFDTNGYPSSRTCEVVGRVVESGHQIVAVTGRSRHSAVQRLQSIAAINHLVCSNGAYAWDVHANRLSWQCAMPTPLVTEIVTRLRRAFTDVTFSWETQNGFVREAFYTELAGGIDELESGVLVDEIGSQAVYKINVRRPNVPTSVLHAELVAVLGESLCEMTTSGAPFLELSAIGAHKGSGLEKSARLLGFTAADTIAFGDNQNDLPMFRWAGNAVAMDNALNENKSLADAVTLSNAEHGVAYYLEQLLDTGKL